MGVKMGDNEPIRGILRTLSEIENTLKHLWRYGALVYFGGLIIFIVILSSIFTSPLNSVEMVCLTVAGCVAIIMGSWIYVDNKRLVKELGEIIKDLPPDFFHR